MSNKRFKYLEIYNQIKHDLISGKYPTGATLPTENEMMDIYGASKTTIRHATKLLADERYIEARQGSGTVVLNFSNYNTRRKYRDRAKIDVRIQTDGPGKTTNVGGYIENVSADERVAARMEIAPGDAVFRIECLQLIDGHAYGNKVGYYNASIFPKLDDIKFRPATDFYGYLQKHYPIKMLEVRDEYDVAILGGQIAIQMGLEPQSPVMMIRRTGYADKGIFMYEESYVRTDVYQMVVTLDEEYIRNIFIDM